MQLREGSCELRCLVCYPLLASLLWKSAYRLCLHTSGAAQLTVGLGSPPTPLTLWKPASGGDDTHLPSQVSFTDCSDFCPLWLLFTSAVWQHMLVWGQLLSSWSGMLISCVVAATRAGAQLLHCGIHASLDLSQRASVLPGILYLRMIMVLQVWWQPCNGTAFCFYYGTQ